MNVLWWTGELDKVINCFGCNLWKIYKIFQGEMNGNGSHILAARPGKFSCLGKKINFFFAEPNGEGEIKNLARKRRNGILRWEISHLFMHSDDGSWNVRPIRAAVRRYCMSSWLQKVMRFKNLFCLWKIAAEVVFDAKFGRRKIL